MSSFHVKRFVAKVDIIDISWIKLMNYRKILTLTNQMFQNTSIPLQKGKKTKVQAKIGFATTSPSSQEPEATINEPQITQTSNSTSSPVPVETYPNISDSFQNPSSFIGQKGDMISKEMFLHIMASNESEVCLDSTFL